MRAKSQGTLGQQVEGESEAEEAGETQREAGKGREKVRRRREEMKFKHFKNQHVN